MKIHMDIVMLYDQERFSKIRQQSTKCSEKRLRILSALKIKCSNYQDTINNDL